MDWKTFNLKKLVEIAKSAGDEILNIYSREDFSEITDFKADNSPLTLADRESHNIISQGLEEAFPGVPVLSEEGKEIPYEERSKWDQFWVVDPLDGTKEFIKRNGEFTVNIALVVDNYPVVGLIYVPEHNHLYIAREGEGAWKLVPGQEKSSLHTTRKKGDFIAVGSRSHSSPEEEEILKKNSVMETFSRGSSLKFCMVAEGNADIYYRHGPTMEWDTAAGQAIVEAAGGKVLNMDGSRFRYNKEDLRNPSFIVTNGYDGIQY